MSTYDFSVTAKQIIIGAMTDLGALASGEQPTPQELADCLFQLNLMVKSWMGPSNPTARGLKMWQRTRATLTLAAKNNFVFKTSLGDLNIAPPVAIVSATVRDTTGVDRCVMTSMLLEEYQGILNKTVTGLPDRFYYEKQLDAGYFYLNRIPSDITWTIPFIYLRTLSDFDQADGSEGPDFPQEWFKALRYNLAVDLFPSYPYGGAARLQAISGLAKNALDQANGFEPQNVVIWFEPGRDDD